jgi:hypothetical protein
MLSTCSVYLVLILITLKRMGSDYSVVCNFLHCPAAAAAASLLKENIIIVLPENEDEVSACVVTAFCTIRKCQEGSHTEDEI